MTGWSQQSSIRHNSSGSIALDMMWATKRQQDPIRLVQRGRYHLDTHLTSWNSNDDWMTGRISIGTRLTNDVYCFLSIRSRFPTYFLSFLYDLHCHILYFKKTSEGRHISSADVKKYPTLMVSRTRPGEGGRESELRYPSHGSILLRLCTALISTFCTPQVL